MNSYRYETHLHTKEASACSVSSAVDLVHAYQQAGYAGIIITDHFYHGNTAVDRRLPWKEWVRRFCLGFETAEAEGKKIGLSVFFGWEINFSGDEYLIYGLDKAWLLAHPQVITYDHQTLFAEVNRAGGLMVQAHPFRERYYLSEIHLHPAVVHAVEVVNAENDEEFDRKAFSYAQRYGLSMTGGSDLHDVVKVGSSSLGMDFAYPLSSLSDFIAAVKEGKGYSLAGSAARMQEPRSEQTTLRVHLHPVG
nr:PHP-associated domain-containing protein [uncultured Sphaerochaeta sp.]